MSRRRYLSTDISTDSKINRLRSEAGDFALVLYTWMIPHASDKAVIEADPEELLAIVCPLMRDKTPEDATNALQAMAEIGLIWWNKDDDVIAFPESFEDYQNYLKSDRRRSPQEVEDHRNSSCFHDVPRNSTKNSASFSFSSSLKSSSSTATVAPAREKPPPQINATYEHTLNGLMPKVIGMFSSIDKQYTESWLRSTLLFVEAELGPLTRSQLGRGIDLALDQLRRATESGKVKSPRPFARKLMIDYLTEQRDEHHAA